MRAFTYWLICMLLLVGLSCSQSKEPQETVSGVDNKLTLDQWREYKLPEKYEPEVLERLRLHDEKLKKSESAWKRYFREHVMPEMKKDFPSSSPVK